MFSLLSFLRCLCPPSNLLLVRSLDKRAGKQLSRGSSHRRGGAAAAACTRHGGHRARAGGSIGPAVGEPQPPAQGQARSVRFVGRHPAPPSHCKAHGARSPLVRGPAPDGRRGARRHLAPPPRHRRGGGQGRAYRQVGLCSSTSSILAHHSAHLPSIRSSPLLADHFLYTLPYAFPTGSARLTSSWIPSPTPPIPPPLRFT